MALKKRIVWPLLGVIASQLICFSAVAVQLTGQLGVHDPSRILKEDGRYYMYRTGFSFAPIQIKYSDNLTHWQTGPGIFDGIPAWAQAEVPNNPGFMWAPDVILHNGEYRLYYSVSSFGSQNSVIGLTTNVTLDFNDPSYEWVDQGMVIESESFGGYPYNAIDPGLFYDDNTGRMWMTWGSFWDGIFITELDPSTGKTLLGFDPINDPINIAARAQGPAIEAPYLMYRDGYYYLFVNWDSCCQSVNSTYNIRVGRGTSPTGPFVDRSGVDMVNGSGELFLGTEGDFIGPGHFGYYSEDGVEYFGYHYYDGDDNGHAKYDIEELAWSADGWPLLAAELPPGDYNRDGTVGPGDYATWRNLLGQSVVPGTRADGTGPGGGPDGVITLLDYEFWKLHYGESLGSGAGHGSDATVPEPATLVLLVIGAMAALVQLRSREYYF